MQNAKLNFQLSIFNFQLLSGVILERSEGSGRRKCKMQNAKLIFNFPFSIFNCFPGQRMTKSEARQVIKISQKVRECGRIGEEATRRARVWQSATGEGDNILRDVLVKWKKKRRTSLPKGETYADESQ